jgi:alginate O-acetyltransferase complex protein AlgI
MIFSSTIFIIYFLPFFLGIYFLAKKKFHNAIVLAFSVFFYAWGAPSFVFILLGSTFVNYLVVWKMNKSSDAKHRQIYLRASVIINLGLLAYFKYANFFIENTYGILTSIGIEAIEWTRIALPIGISFFTFQSLTYTIDTYRKISKPLDKYTDYLLYILMFPQLIAGPIVRYNTIAEQIKDRSSSMEDRLVGFYRFSIGLAKKVLIANVMAETADQIMAMDYAGMNSTTAWIGILAYTYGTNAFDFSGTLNTGDIATPMLTYSGSAQKGANLIGNPYPSSINWKASGWTRSNLLNSGEKIRVDMRLRG